MDHPVILGTSTFLHLVFPQTLFFFFFSFLFQFPFKGTFKSLKCILGIDRKGGFRCTSRIIDVCILPLILFLHQLEKQKWQYCDGDCLKCTSFYIMNIINHFLSPLFCWCMSHFFSCGWASLFVYFLYFSVCIYSKLLPFYSTNHILWSVVLRRF